MTEADRPVLVALSGLPGTGKTTVGRALAAALDAVFLRIDSIETALARSSLAIARAQDAGYGAAMAVAEDNLRLGHDVVADSVNPVAATQFGWRRAAQAAGAGHLDVVLTCRDAARHRARVEGRHADLAGQLLPTWQDVLERDWTPPPGGFLVDTGDLAPDESVAAILARLRTFRAAAAGA